MTTTKFRGQILDGPRKGEWVYGYLLNFTGDDGNMGCYIFEDNSSEFYSIPEMLIEVDPKTVGQYTGLHDKSDNEIYKDDMLKDKLGTGKVTWMTPSFVVVDFDGKLWNLGGGVVYPEGSTMKETEIIGNVHDNPSLLTQ